MTRTMMRKCVKRFHSSVARKNTVSLNEQFHCMCQCASCDIVHGIRIFTRPSLIVLVSCLRSKCIKLIISLSFTMRIAGSIYLSFSLFVNTEFSAHQSCRLSAFCFNSHLQVCVSNGTTILAIHSLQKVE